MDREYDLKFEEMKKYIPFLENMINRLESTSSASNPRQAQLDKIRSLRDLLLDKKKRMKMDNLLKCEQVLVNLYAKVEQREALPGIQPALSPHNNKDVDPALESVRNKLKSITTKTIDQDTLPEIARASATEELCTPGSKEPALFQRRPNKASPSSSLQRSPAKSANSSSSRRSYTRILVSPEQSSRRWSSNERNPPLFSRRSPRSPRRSPKRRSPPYSRKDRRKSKQEPSKKAKDLNITLNVPEESLNSLNTKDILSRIMNCCDNDVDIETLREAKRQILSELKHTGAKYDDISDLLLKSYKNRGFKKKEDVEEGELSDSESEAIQSIYGNFILDDSENSSKNKGDRKEKPRKIQICLVLNSNTEDLLAGSAVQPITPSNVIDDFELCSEEQQMNSEITDNNDKTSLLTLNNNSDVVVTKDKIKNIFSDSDKTSEHVATNEPANFYTPLKDSSKRPESIEDSSSTCVTNSSNTCVTNSSNICISNSPNICVSNSPNICISNDDVHVGNTDTMEKIQSKPSLDDQLKEAESKRFGKNEDTNDEIEKSTRLEKPLLNEPSINSQQPKEEIVSEIDILQALKNEILSESLSIPGSEITPSLHQPKITKVLSVQEIIPKKRISLEKYKKKAISSSTSTSLFVNDPNTVTKEDNLRKQSLKLTEKECERFKLSAKLALDDADISADEEINRGVSLDEIYAGLEPKSPDCNEPQNYQTTAPIIIPIDPVETALSPLKSDVDMRTLISQSPTTMTSALGVNESKSLDKSRISVDPRIRKDLNQASSPDNPLVTNLINKDRVTNAQCSNFPLNMTPNINSSTNACMTPNMPPSMTPNRNPSMTPNRYPNMTPNARTFEINRKSFDMDDNLVPKHVYAPMFPFYDQSNNREQSVTKENEHQSYWDNAHEIDYASRTRWEAAVDKRDRNSRSASVQRDTSDYSKPRYNDSYNNRHADRRDSYNRTECPRTPLPSFGRSDVPTTPSHPFGRLDAPLTPLHTFGRSECPPTPNHPFGRLDCPPTPSHPFGRLECPPTPTHTFGRADCPATPSHPFGRSDCPLTPIHTFGRSDMPMTPNHPFGRSEHSSRDPRLKRSSDYENIKNDDRLQYTDRNRSGLNSYNKSDSYQVYREQSVGRYEKNSYSSHDRDKQYSKRDQNRSNRERHSAKDFDKERTCTRDHYNTHDNDTTYRNLNRAQSIGRSMSKNDRSSSYRNVARMAEDIDQQSVMQHADKSFAIDTSVNSTFQDFITSTKKQVFNNNFDNRRKRAASVGRMFQRETSIGRSVRETSVTKYFRESSVGRSHRESSSGRSFRETSVGRSNPQENRSSLYDRDHNKRDDFRRARSVGRDFLGNANCNDEKSFKDIKADFKQYKASYDAKFEKSVMKMSTSCSKYMTNDNATNLHKSHSEVEVIRRSSQRYDIKKYSPLKNSRDPRMRRESNNSSNKYTHKDKKNLGIVYTHDNITKGTILGPGYGVKNYKIPKIKRPVEDNKINEDTKIKEKERMSAVKTTDQNAKSKKPENSDKSVKLERNVKSHNNLKNTVKKGGNNNNVAEKSVKPTTLLSKKSESSLSENVDGDLDFIRKNKKVKVPVIHDSDSETEGSQNQDTNATSLKNSVNLKNVNTQNTNQKEPNLCISKTAEKVLPQTDDKCPSNNPLDPLESNFMIDDLELFSDNLASDPVIDNINDIIAGLDTDLEPEKLTTTEDLSSDINLENMLEDIDSNEKNVEKLSEELNDISEVISNDLVESDKIQRDQKEKISFDSKEIPRNVDNLNENVHNKAVKNTDGKKLRDTKNRVSEISNEKESKHPQNVLKIMDDRVLNTTNNKADENSISDNNKEIKTACGSLRNVHENLNTAADDKTEETYRNILEPADNKCTNDNTVSTSGISKKVILSEKGEKNNIPDLSSTPDSTNEIVAEQTKVPEESLPDSTNGSQNDINSVVTSSHDSVQIGKMTNTNVEASTSNEDMTSMHSLGNILSLLQNKSKLKEILSMLGDHSSENEKIKKKLEKLSEIVSDEDETVSKENENESDLSNSCIQDKSNESRNDTNSQPNQDQSACDTFIDEKSLGGKSKECSPNINGEKQELKYKKKKQIKRRRGKFAKKKKAVSKGVQRLTRSGAKEKAIKKPSRELMKLQEDIKEMFISDDVLNATGLRMCRLAKFVDDSNVKVKHVSAEESPEPVVILEKFKDSKHIEKNASDRPIKKKSGPKPKQTRHKSVDTETSVKETTLPKYKPGPKSKKPTQNTAEDPYAFESDSVSESNYNMKSGEDNDVCNSDNETSNSSINSDLLGKKKNKRKKSEWQLGIIKTKSKKKKGELKQIDHVSSSQKLLDLSQISCFTDKTYCFRKNVSEYSCRLCIYNGNDIVNHYKQQHPHSEIPLSRLSPEMAKGAIDQCEEINFQAISKIPSEKYVCRFCLREFSRKKAALEAFFWHVVSMHTGEYKQLCSICEEDKCPFYLDIPPPPKDVKGQLIGYICEKCNFTQISLENLKTHVIVRHNDEQTEVYTINLAIMSKKAINKLILRSKKEHEPPRTLRSHRSNQSLTGTSDEQSDITDSDVSNEPFALKCQEQEKMSPPSNTSQKSLNTAHKSKITFENDDSSDTTSIAHNINNVIKVEKLDDENSINDNNPATDMEETPSIHTTTSSANLSSSNIQTADIPPDIYIHPHFKVSYTAGGSKEYLCCVNSLTYHYKTSLVISLKKHVQTKHSETWDGYCCVCKVIVTVQGKHSIKDCLQHYLDKHTDNFPVFESVTEDLQMSKESDIVAPMPNKTYINVRPLSELISDKVITPPEDNLPVLPKIEFDTNLDITDDQALQVQDNDSYTSVFQKPMLDERQYKYEEIQAEVYSKKHRVVLDAMINKRKLVHVFKCAGRFCSYSSDSVEESLLHASTHQRVGGERSLMCTYCDFDCSENAIDLVMHVFKAHGSSPYVCGYCFYRAASTQLVLAHVTRVHKELPLKVLSSVNATPPMPSEMLQRDKVIRPYVCGHHDCNESIFVTGQFTEHLRKKHSEADGHPCYLCAEVLPSPAELVQHMQAHDINIYQCAFCHYGADTENNLLNHTSQKHPSREPLAYMRAVAVAPKQRIVDLKMLPLTTLHKVKVPVEEVQPCTVNENPVKDAERSIELEKLIGQTTQVIEPTVPISTQSRSVSAMQFDQMEESILPDSEPLQIPMLGVHTELTTPLLVAPPLTTPPLQPDKSEQMTPVLKTEMPPTPTKDLSSDIVYCLGSDEEDEIQSDISINTSNVDKPTASLEKYVKIHNSKLLTCPKCSHVYKDFPKSSTFMKHLLSCCIDSEPLFCAHCRQMVNTREALLKHYILNHCEFPYTCSVCNERFYAPGIARLHLKKKHKIRKVVYNSHVTAKGKFEYIVSEQVNKLATTRSASIGKPAKPTGRRESSATGPERRLQRYGPEDIDRLPINPILDEPVICACCEFSTKVRLNMVRHLQMHADSQPSPSSGSAMQFDQMEESILPDSEPLQISMSGVATELQTPLLVAPPLTTPPLQPDNNELMTPVLKKEMPPTPTKDLSSDIVYCLDSDEEDEIQSDISIITSNVDKPTASLEKYVKIHNSKLLTCPKCSHVYKDFPKSSTFMKHLLSCCIDSEPLFCAHCRQMVNTREALLKHYILNHCEFPYTCSVCNERFYASGIARLHLKNKHKITKVVIKSHMRAKGKFEYVLSEQVANKPATTRPASIGKPAKPTGRRKSSATGPERRLQRYGPEDINRLPINPILDEPVICARCEFSTKVRLNMVRHLQMHADSQPAPSTAPVNPVPHLETNEMYFDRMVNLASSSLVREKGPAAPAASTADSEPLKCIPPEAAARYPRYVPDRQRHACGANGCSYISLDEAMLRCHWETLHANSDAFKCVHCPPYQQLDTKRPITAARIIAHLKMHDANLYGCSMCPYYHFKRYMIERHLHDAHAGNGSVLLVREESNNSGTSAPTMDLKPWRCGLCNFMSMIRPEVAEHCFTCHQSKMQFKCFYCPFRASAEDSVTKHQANVHAGKKIDVFYFYYREGSIPGENEGCPLWMRQRQRCGLEPTVKQEQPTPDLNIVKQETEVQTLLSTPQLCAIYSEFCEPNGLLYKCAFCKVVMEPTSEAMRSHLYEELNYRRWGCALCSYKAFHKTGLHEHMKSEHRNASEDPTQLPIKVDIEAWVSQFLEYQTSAIQKNKENLAKQKVRTERPQPKEASPSTSSGNQIGQEKDSEGINLDFLMQAFGPLGTADGTFFCCPKCSFQSKDETEFTNHMEIELTKIRWCCNTCTETFQTYHEAQFHCRSMRDSDQSHQSARPVEAPRSPTCRATWLKNVVNSQREAIKLLKPAEKVVEPDSEEVPENALLVVRYEKIITPEEPQVSRKRPASPLVVENKVEHLEGNKALATYQQCPHCSYTCNRPGNFKTHLKRHFRYFTCKLCRFNGIRSAVIQHLKVNHDYSPSHSRLLSLMEEMHLPRPPKTKKIAQDDTTQNVCLVCERSLTEEETERHGHENMKSEFGKKGDIVIKCCTCLTLRIDMTSFQEHHAESHPNEEINYAFSRLLHDSKEIHCCRYCKKRFKYSNDLRSHHNAVHRTLPLKYDKNVYSSPSRLAEIDDVVEVSKRPNPESPTVAPKRVATKSTTKLPAQAFAKKSTTKLPFNYDDDDGDDDDDEEYSYYGTKPTPLDTYANVTTLMSFCNRMMPFTVHKLSELIKIDPVVLVEDVKSSLPHNN